MERSFSELLPHVPNSSEVIEVLDKAPIIASLKNQAVKDTLALVHAPYGIRAAEGFLLHIRNKYVRPESSRWTE